ncbi:hypothetical protein KUTeg_012502 [Tegillarca granosa]|uniref:Calpain 6 n=1 Tax=Tegillarca granosa TaxID=220873 RepID=A0ABQ9F314_TEGGR|nr:hypothetical protein KUTeg_012502 [Tegillarca granosa]
MNVHFVLVYICSDKGIITHAILTPLCCICISYSEMVLGFDSTTPYKGQKYHKLQRQCTRSNKLFVDPEFPPNGSSLFHSRPAPADIVWKRPGDIVQSPKFFAEGASADDFSQGSIGNCWFVAACACIVEDNRLWKKIVPDYEEQEWSKDRKYAGIFHFKFWQCGRWIDVVIDDYLPTRNGQLVFLQSKSRDEFWSPLLEKAYAKLFGDYESLTGGKARDAMVDMTGGVGEGIEIRDYRTQEEKMKLFKILNHAMDDRSLMSASITASGRDMEAQLACGLVKGHAYSITAVRNIKLGKGLLAFFKREKIHMIRLRNPWGGVEWKGAWSDGSAEWKQVSASEKKELGLTFDDNGEFWMSFEDFCRYFTSMDICHIINRSFISLKKTWREGKFLGQWKKPDRCGGCGNYQTFLQNPQYIFDVKEPEEIMISLEQWDKRTDKDRGKSNFTIGVSVLKADLNRKYRMHDRMDKVSSGPFSNGRSIFSRVELTEGRYVIIPSTFEPGLLGQYVLRVYSANNLELRELIYDEPPPPSCMCISGVGRPKVSSTQITIVKAEGLEAQDSDGSSDPYCIVYCEKKVIQTNYCKNSLNPEWNARVTFYHKNPDKDIQIEVWNHNIIKDEFMGMVNIPMSQRNTYKGGNIIKRYELYGKGKDASTKRQGYLWLKIYHTPEMRLI